MLLSFLMLALWQGEGPQYQEPFKRCVEATYHDSELKSHVDSATELVKKKQPILTGVAPIAYAVVVKRQVRLTSRKISPLPNAVTTYYYDDNTKSGSVGISWSF